MAIAFPRDGLSALVGFAPASRPFFLTSRVETSRTVGGVTLAKELGPALWNFDLRTAPIERRRAMAVLAWLQSLDGPVRSLLMHDPSRPAPAADIGASLASVAIHSVTGVALRLKGLPAGFVLTPGDMLAFDYGTGPKRALHEAAEMATADGSGVTPLFEVRPRIRAGAEADAPVALRNAAGVFRLTEWAAEPVGRTLMAFTLQGEQVI